MNRKRIVALILVSVFCSLAIAGFIVFQKFFSHQSLQTRAVKLLSNCVRGEVTVGEVDFNPFSGITIKELNISDPTARNKHPVIKVSEIFLELHPLSLLCGRFLIRGITVASPEVFIAKSDKGDWNIRELIMPDFKWPFFPVKGSLKDGIVIKDARVNFTSQESGLLTRFVGVQVFLSPSPESIAVYNISGNIDDNFWGNYSFIGNLDLTHHLTPPPQGGRAGVGLDLNVSARNIFLCEELIKGIPFVGAKVWDSLMPQGSVNLTCSIKYDDKGDQPGSLYYDFVAGFKEGAFKFKGWPLPVHGLTGIVEFSNGHLYLENLKGNIGNVGDAASISFNGDICLDERGGILTVDVSNVTGTEELVRMIPKVGDKVWTNYKPTGRVDASATCIVKDNKVKLDSVTINLRDTNATYIHWPLPVHGATGRLEISKGNLYVKKLHGYVGEGHSTSFDLQGQINLKGTDGVFNVNVSNINVTEKIIRMIPSFGQRIWTEYMPEGRCDVSVTCNVDDRKINYDAIIDLRDMEFLCDRWPFPVIGARGKIEYSRNNLYFKNVSGYMVTGMLTNDKNLSTAHFNLDGLVDITAPSCLLTFETANLAVSEPLVRKIPGLGDRLWETLKPLGRIDVRMDYRINGRSKNPEFYTVINCKEVEILCAKLPVPVSNLSGFIEANGNTVYTRELKGRTCNGDVSAVLGLDLGSSPIRYKLKLNFTNTDLSEFVKVALKLDKQWSGFISGQSEFYCHGNGTATMSGKGEINLREGNIFDMPIILSFFKVLNLSLPAKDIFHTAHVEYTIENGIVHIEKANLVSDTVEISGTGDVNLDGRIDMLAIVVFRDTSFLSGIPIIGEVKDFLIGGIVRRLTKFEIKGTVMDPKTKPVSLEALKYPSVKNVFELLKSE